MQCSMLPGASISEFGLPTNSESSAGEVALYLHTSGELPDNFITKNEARERGLGQVTPTQDGVRSAVLVSSVTFGLGHLLNLVNGSGAGLAENLFQVTGAIAIGFCF